MNSRPPSSASRRIRKERSGQKSRFRTVSEIASRKTEIVVPIFCLRLGRRIGVPRLATVPESNRGVPACRAYVKDDPVFWLNRRTCGPTGERP